MTRNLAPAGIRARRSPRKRPAGGPLALLLTLALVTFGMLALSGTGAAGAGMEMFAGQGFGAEYVFNAATTTEITTTALSETTVVVVYRDEGNANHGTAVVGEVTANGIVFGAEYVFNAAATYDISATALSATKFAVAYRDSGNLEYGTVVVGEVTGTAIAFEAESVFKGYYTTDTSIAALAESTFVVAYRDIGTNSGRAIIGVIGESGIAFGSEYVFNAATTQYIAATALSESTFAVGYLDTLVSATCLARVGQVAGNQITFGSAYTFNAAEADYISATALSGSAFALAYRDLGNMCYGTAVIGEVTGNTISFGSEQVFNAAVYTNWISATALSATRLAVAYADYAAWSAGTAILGEVSGNEIVFGPEEVFNSARSDYISASALSETKFAVGYNDDGNSGYGTAAIGGIAPPTVQTDPATGATYTAATLNGDITATGGEDADQRGFRYRKQGDVDWLEWSESAGPYGVGGYGHELTGLSRGTTYEFRAWAHNSGGRGEGEIITFMTATDVPLVQSAAATAATSSSATLNGNVTDVGDGDCDQRGFQYRLQGDTTWLDWHESAGPYGTGAFAHDLGSLAPDSTYEFKARAHNVAGWGEGEVLTFTTLPVPAITMVSPAADRIGVVVTITGTGFGAERGTSSVKFGTVEATIYSSWADTLIKVKVPAGIAGKVSLTVTTGGGISNGVPFKVKPYAGTISPTSGAAGTVVTIPGTGFGATRGTSYVKFGTVKATSYVSWFKTLIRVRVPAGAYGAASLTVTTGGGTSNARVFKVKPKIAGLNPASGAPGTQVTIAGTGFGVARGTSTVRFGATQAQYVSWSNTRVVVRVPAMSAGATLVTVTTAGGASAGASFTVK